MSKAPTVRVSTMSNLLDSLTVVLGANVPLKVLRSDVMSVAREALKIHNAMEAELTTLRLQLAAAKARERVLREGLEKLESYNREIAADRINYRPEDHIQVARQALAAAPEAGEEKGGEDGR